MNLPHDIRFLAHEWFMRSLRKCGFTHELNKTGKALSALNQLIHEAMLRPQTKDDEANIIDAIAEVEVYMHQLIKALGAENTCKVAIQTKLDQLMDELLKKK